MRSRSWGLFATTVSDQAGLVARVPGVRGFAASSPVRPGVCAGLCAISQSRVPGSMVIRTSVSAAPQQTRCPTVPPTLPPCSLAQLARPGRDHVTGPDQIRAHGLPHPAYPGETYPMRSASRPVTIPTSAMKRPGPARPGNRRPRARTLPARTSPNFYRRRDEAPGHIVGIQRLGQQLMGAVGMGVPLRLAPGLAGSRRWTLSEPGGTTCHLTRSWC